jgi:tRNA (cytidine56-2'-O)-methyltransferase
MANSKSNQPSAQPSSNEASAREIVVLRWGHRVQRDARLTSHVALAARAFGASGFLLADAADEHLEATVKKVTKNWGGNFRFEMGIHWKDAVNEWKNEGGTVVHLTIYGENVQTSDVLSRIRDCGKNVLLLIGSQKVPPEFYCAEVSDFNVSIGNQPHSECAAVAVFLDRFFEGKELSKSFTNAKIRVVPQERNKKIEVKHGF